MGEVSDPGGEERLGGRSRGEDARLCVTGWAAFHSSPVSRGKKIASKKGKISFTSEKIQEKEFGWKSCF
jgi:hypothetical protein